MGVNQGNETSAAACRRMGWRVGTRIIGIENGKPDIWEITAVGRDNIMKVTIKNGCEGREVQATLAHRDWTELKEADHG